jgi:hypothetical protein
MRFNYGTHILKLRLTPFLQFEISDGCAIHKLQSRSVGGTISAHPEFAQEYYTKLKFNGAEPENIPPASPVESLKIFGSLISRSM